MADISKIKKMLKWHPKISIENGIQMLLKNLVVSKYISEIEAEAKQISKFEKDMRRRELN